MVFDSVYEVTDAAGTVGKTRVVEFFDGELLDTRWVFTDLTGVGSGAMLNAVDGGYTVTTGATSGNQSSISYGGTAPSHFCTNNTVVIAIVERPVASMQTLVGMSEKANLCGACCSSLMAAENDTCDTNYQLLTNDGTTAKTTATCTAIDTTRRVLKLDLDACTVSLFLCGGAADATHVCNLPNAALHPTFHVKSRASGTKAGRISYLEAYNT